MNEKCQHEYINDNGDIQKCGDEPTIKTSDDEYFCINHLEEHIKNNFELN